MQDGLLRRCAATMRHQARTSSNALASLLTDSTPARLVRCPPAPLPPPPAAMWPVLPPVSADCHLPRPAPRADEPPHPGDVDDDGLRREVQVRVVDHGRVVAARPIAGCRATSDPHREIVRHGRQRSGVGLALHGATRPSQRGSTILSGAFTPRSYATATMRRAAGTVCSGENLDLGTTPGQLRVSVQQGPGLVRD